MILLHANVAQVILLAINYMKYIFTGLTVAVDFSAFLARKVFVLLSKQLSVGRL